jgi:hypothetical protein
MKEQLLGIGLLCVVTYLLLRFRDFFLALGQDRPVSPRKLRSSESSRRRPRLAGSGRERSNGNFGPRGSIRSHMDLRRVYVKLRQFSFFP